ncbi:hypothetical protein T439DRAFT_132220 [Meredithblackwellia eburnea MCA 4105]
MEYGNSRARKREHSKTREAREEREIDHPLLIPKHKERGTDHTNHRHILPPLQCRLVRRCLCLGFRQVGRHVQQGRQHLRPLGCRSRRHRRLNRFHSGPSTYLLSTLLQSKLSLHPGDRPSSLSPSLCASVCFPPLFLLPYHQTNTFESFSPPSFPVPTSHTSNSFIRRISSLSCALIANPRPSHFTEYTFVPLFPPSSATI